MPFTEAEYQALKKKSDDQTAAALVEKTKIDEFRENNRKLVEDAKADKAKYGDVDLEKYNEMVAKTKKDDEDALLKANKFEELTAKRVKAVEDANKVEFDKVKAINDTQTKQLEMLIVDNAIRAASVTEGVIETAVSDMVLRAKSVFKVKDGKAVAFDAAGVNIYKTGTTEHISVADWVKSQSEVAPHLFKESKGTDAKNKTKIPLTPEQQANQTPAQLIQAGMEEIEAAK